MADPIVTPEQGNVTPPAQDVAPSTTPSQEENVVTPEKLEDYKRKLKGSTEEALRLKKENEELAEKLKALETPPETQDGQYQISSADIEAFRLLQKAAKEAEEAAEKARLEQEAAEKAGMEAKYAEVQRSTVAVWVNSHPEYSKIGDPESDKLWAAIEEKVKTLPPPKNPEDWGKVLDIAHKELNSGNQLERGKALGYAQANLQEQTRLGGGSSGGSSTPKQKRTPEQQAVLDELRELRPQLFKQE